VTVTSASGFEAAGVAAGIKSSGTRDLALVVNRGPLTAAAAVFTSNRAQANPILWSKQVIQDGVASAIVLNSGGANCFTGAQGFQTTHSTAEAVGEALGVSAGDVLVCSTGLIGEQLDAGVLAAGVRTAAAQLSADGGADGPSAAWRRAPGCWRRASPRCWS
jgi:glutamate N-acetyltransferase / amino-acid N-acetyltransferase